MTIAIFVVVFLVIALVIFMIASGESGKVASLATMVDTSRKTPAASSGETP